LSRRDCHGTSPSRAWSWQLHHVYIHHGELPGGSRRGRLSSPTPTHTTE